MFYCTAKHVYYRKFKKIMKRKQRLSLVKKQTVKLVLLFSYHQLDVL